MCKGDYFNKNTDVVPFYRNVQWDGMLYLNRIGAERAARLAAGGGLNRRLGVYGSMGGIKKETPR